MGLSEELIHQVLQQIGEDPWRDGLRDTPTRVVRSWEELYGGYTGDVQEVFKTFEDPSSEMVVLRDIEFYSMCEHHMLPFFGKAHIGYLPNGRVIGISKLARLLDIFARRLQIQERIGQQVCDALMDHLKPEGCGVILEAQHLCMTARGVGKQNSVMKTNCLRGSFMTDPQVRSEFLSAVK